MAIITEDSVSILKMPSALMATWDNVEVSTRLGNLENQLSPCALRIYKTPKPKAREVFIVTRKMSLGKMPKTS